MVLKQLCINIKKKPKQFNPTLHHKFEIDHVLKMKTKIMKLLREKIGDYFCHFRINKNVLGHRKHKT